MSNKTCAAATAALLAITSAGCDFHRPSDLSKRDLFEMKQQCAESVPRVLKYGIDYGENTTRFRAHYNARLNMCFVVIQWHTKLGEAPFQREHFTIVDAQSYMYIDIEPGEKLWMDLMEQEEFDKPDLQSEQAREIQGK